MNLQYIHTPFQIRFVYNNPSVKPSRTQKRGIQDFRTVGCRKNQKTFIRVKSIHLCQELVQCLFSLVIAAHNCITCFSDSVDFINKHNTRSHLLSLLEQITHTGRAHAYIHFHKSRTRKREERHFCLSRHSFRQQCLTSSRRPYKKCSFRKLRADAAVFTRIMKEIHYFLQRLLCLILPGHILECDPGFFLHVHFCIALSDAHHTAAFCHLPHEEAEQNNKKDNRQYHCHNNFKNQRACRIRHFAGKLYAGLIENLRQSVVTDIPGIIVRITLSAAAGLILNLTENVGDSAAAVILPGFFLSGSVRKSNIDSVACQLYFFYFLIFHQIKKFVITDLFRTGALHKRI